MGDGNARLSREARHAPVIAPMRDPAFRALKALVIGRTGHHYYEDKDGPLWEHIARRMQACAIGEPAVYLQRLEDPAAGPREWRLLESAITINETFFFRFAEQFDVLRRILLPELVGRASETRRLRIWSVGCSTGAEPYSVAVLLHDLLGDALPNWRIAITGTDIDESALRVARAAEYTPWALRTVGEEERARLFDRDGERYRLKPQYRRMVRFEHHNMMSLLDASTTLQFNDFDLILCRNVLIYFSPEVATRLVGALAERLARDGHLLVGHAELSPAFDQVAVPVPVGGVLAYRRLGTVPSRAAAPLAPVAAHVQVPTVPAPRPPAPPRATPRHPEPEQARPAPAPVLPALDAARSALAAGDARQGIELAGQAAEVAPRDPVPHYLGAIGALALGDEDRAEQGFRKALYLDNRFAMAHYLLGRQLLAQGRTDDGRRALANAARVVAALDPQAELAEGDGITAGALAAAVRSVLA